MTHRVQPGISLYLNSIMSDQFFERLIRHDDITRAPSADEAVYLAASLHAA
jgi:hypothetical protein